MKITNRWGYAETWGTDNHTYPSKKCSIEKDVGKMHGCSGELFRQKNVLGDQKRELSGQLIGICLGSMGEAEKRLQWELNFPISEAGERSLYVLLGELVCYRVFLLIFLSLTYLLTY